MQPIKIAQIGVGHNHAAEKMRTVRKLNTDFEMIGVAEPDPVWIEKRGGSKAYEGVKFYPSVEALLDTPGLQAVMVETDIPDLVPIAKMCAERDLHIHIDKPAGFDIQAYRDLLRDVKQRGLVYQMGYMYRGNAAARDAMRRARAGELGEIYHMDAQLSMERALSYRQYLTNYPKGNLYIFGCHMFDMILHVMGMPDKVTSFCSESGKAGLAVTDNCVTVLSYPHGTSVVRNSSVEVNGFGRRQLVICGSTGTIEVKPLETPTIYSRSDSAPDRGCDNRRILGFPQTTGRYEGHLSEFAKMIRGETENEFSYEHEFFVQYVALAACGLIPYEKPSDDFVL